MRGIVVSALVILAVVSATADTEVQHVAEKSAPTLEETPEIAALEEKQSLYDDGLQGEVLEEEKDDGCADKELEGQIIEEEDVEGQDIITDADDQEEVDKLLTSSSTELETEERTIEDENNIDVENVHKRWVCYRHYGCYLVFRHHLRWNQARHVCRRHGGELASIHNGHQNNLMRALAHRFGNLWIGMNDGSKEMCYRWSDQSRINYNKWHPGEPNNLHNEDCVEVYRNGYWNDRRCHHRRRFVCRKRWHHHHYHYWG